MFQCLGLGSVETGGCGEDWWHPECLIGLSRDWYKNKKAVTFGGDAAAEGAVDGAVDVADEDDETPLPPGFPGEDDFEHLICFKCIDSTPWLKRYAGTPGFLPPVYRNGGIEKPVQAVPEVHAAAETTKQEDNSKKRKADDDEPAREEPSAKRTKEEDSFTKGPEPEPSKLATVKEEDPSTNPSTTHTTTTETTTTNLSKPKHASLPNSAPEASFSLFLLENFHERLCRCAECFPNLIPHPQLREEEETYEPPLSDDGEDGNAAGSTGTGSLLERGEAALSNVDRVRAIEGAMIYNHLRDKVKDFLKPFAESGQAVSAEDIKGYFEKLRGDEQGIKDAAGRASAMGNGGGGDNAEGDNRREQNGEFDALSYPQMTVGH
jgi:E3 ubiquitin-protein ligase UBR7